MLVETLPFSALHPPAQRRDRCTSDAELIVLIANENPARSPHGVPLLKDCGGVCGKSSILATHQSRQRTGARAANGVFKNTFSRSKRSKLGLYAFGWRPHESSQAYGRK
jgi:hypothetical protein